LRFVLSTLVLGTVKKKKKKKKKFDFWPGS